jgi:hypothetical protein
MKQILITATHPRSGVTRAAGTTLAIGAANGDDVITEFDANRCVADGLGEWVESREKPSRK